MKRNWGVFIVLIFIGVLVAGYFWENQGKDKSSLPQYALRSAEVQAAYEYSIKNPELLSYIPCYCNCYRLGHKDVGKCFIKEFKDNGQVVFDEHGANCGICYSTVLDSQSLFEQGKTTQEIRDFVDNKYSQYGQGTLTPLP